MFDFPQPGEIYRSAGFPDVAVVGILEDGIPWEMPYRCPDIVWNPYRRKFSILVRILADGRTTDIPLGRFLREFTCDRPDLFKRSPVNRHAVLKDNVEINREKAARYGMTVADVQLFVTSAVGGAMVGETVEGIARYPINLRYPQSWRDSPQALRQLPILNEAECPARYLPHQSAPPAGSARRVRSVETRCGYAGSPWTLATYMVEGGGSKAFTVIKKMMYADPQALHALLDKLAKSVTLYLNAQIKAGAQAVMIFDTWGGVLTGRDYQQFSLYYMHKNGYPPVIWLP